MAFHLRLTHCVPASVDMFFFPKLPGQRRCELFNLVNNFLIANVVLSTETAYQKDTSTFYQQFSDVVQHHHQTSTCVQRSMEMLQDVFNIIQRIQHLINVPQT